MIFNIALIFTILFFNSLHYYFAKPVIIGFIVCFLLVMYIIVQCTVITLCKCKWETKARLLSVVEASPSVDHSYLRDDDSYLSVDSSRPSVDGSYTLVSFGRRLVCNSCSWVCFPKRLVDHSYTLVGVPNTLVSISNTLVGFRKRIVDLRKRLVGYSCL
jgi:hypothetical protein